MIWGMSDVILGGEALAAGIVTRHELRRDYRLLYRGVYVANRVDVSLRHRAIAAWLAGRRRGVVAGVAAAALHGAPWVDATQPIELVGAKIRPQPGLVPRIEEIAEDEVTRRFGLPVTTRVRTAFDLGRHLPRAEALERLDALMWNQAFDVDEVLALAQRYPRARGVRQLRELLPLVDGGAAAPRESRLRLYLHDAGLPRPETQIPVVDGTAPVAYLDMGWREYMVAVEYDGDHHRLRMLDDRGWLAIRVIAEEHPHDWLARVFSALSLRGYRSAGAAA